MRLMRRAVIGVTVLAVAALSGCQSGGGGTGTGAADGREDRAQQRTAVVQALQTVAKKTEEAKSVRVESTMTVGGEDGVDMKMSGVMSWDPVAMDMTTTGGPTALTGGDPVEFRTLMVDNVVYVNLGEEAAQEFGGKPWLKMDLEKAAEESGDDQLLGMLTGDKSGMNQDPSQQMGLLLESPEIKRVGKETIDGVATEHYSGTLTVEEALDAGPSSDHLTAEEREELLSGMKEGGVEDMDLDVWVDERGYPVRFDMKMNMAGADFTISQHYSDYGTEVSVKAPPASQTADMTEMWAEEDGPGL